MVRESPGGLRQAGRRGGGVAWRLLVAVAVAICFAVPVSDAVATRPVAATVAAHGPLGVVVTGDLVRAPASMTTYSGNAFWLTRAEVAALKASRGAFDPHGDLWVSGWYSWCENHGTPIYGWTSAAGIGLMRLLSDAGLSEDQIAALGAVTITAAPDTDSFSYAIDLGLSRRLFETVDAKSGELVNPVLALYLDDADTYGGLLAEATTPVDDAYATLVFGQLTPAESNRCGFVKGASLVALPESSPAFVVDAPDAYATSDDDRQKTRYSLAALVGEGDARRTYHIGAAAFTCDGVDLKSLLDGAGGAICPQDEILLTTTAGQVDPELRVADVGAGDYLLAYYSQDAGGAPVANATQVMLYGAGTAVADVVSLRVKHVDPTASLKITSPTASQFKATIVAGGRLALRAVTLPAPGALRAGPVIWTSSAPAVATVNLDGTVTALRTGSSVVRAESGAFSQTLTVSVVARKKDATGIKLSEAEIVSAGDVMRLAVRISPSASTSTVTWKSSSPAVAVVDRGGTITAVKRGRTTISVRTSNGKKARCLLRVE